MQRICKYPLLFRELQKYTAVEEPAAVAVSRALESVRDVASVINEDKRVAEQIAMIQSKLDGWEVRHLPRSVIKIAPNALYSTWWQGPELGQLCTKLFCEGSLLKYSGGKRQERYFYLFDDLLVYCKRSANGIMLVSFAFGLGSFGANR